MIRAFERNDAAQVARLSRRVFPGHDHRSLADYEKAYEEVFLRSPWFDERISSLVYVDARGIVVGFLGVMPRLMSFQGKRVVAAVSQHLMIDPEKKNPTAGVELLKRFLAGPQEVSMADMANPISRKIWERLGGVTSLAHSIHWRRPLRLGRFLLSQIAVDTGSAQALMRPITSLVDTIGAKWSKSPFKLEEPATVEEELDPATHLLLLEEYGAQLVYKPAYDVDSLLWIREAIASQQRYGDIRFKLVREKNNEIVGWYVYYLNPHQTSDVIQIGGAPGKMDIVLKSLFYHAWTDGVVELAGRVDPRFMKQLSDSSCLFVPGRTWMLLFSKNVELLNAIHRGDTFLTRLEGDLWLV